MQDYHIYAHYVDTRGLAPTSPKYVRIEPKTKVLTNRVSESQSNNNFPTKELGVVIGGAMKINQYVGEITENTISASRRQTGLSYAAMTLYSLKNPIVGIGSMALFTANKVINYQIRQYKENLSADFLRQLSGGTVKTRG